MKGLGGGQVSGLLPLTHPHTPREELTADADAQTWLRPDQTSHEPGVKALFSILVPPAWPGSPTQNVPAYAVDQTQVLEARLVSPLASLSGAAQPQAATGYLRT